MKSTKPRKRKGEQGSSPQNISKSITDGEKSLKSSGGQQYKVTGNGCIPVGKNVLSKPCGISPEHGDCNSDKVTSPGTVKKVPSGPKPKDDQRPRPSAKIKLQLFPLDEGIRVGLEKDGHNPFLELTLRARKKVSSVLEHLHHKWGSSSIAIGELMLFPFNIMMDNLTSCRRWTFNDIGITAEDVHAALGNPEIFRLRYGWVSTQLESSPCSPSLGCTEHGHLERIPCSAIGISVSSKNQTELKSKELKPCDTNELANMLVEQTIPAELLTVVVDPKQTEAKSKDFKPSKNSEIDNAVEEKSSVEPFKYEEERMDSDPSLKSLLWSDLSNISIGGLLSESSLQGRFSTQDIKSGDSRLASQPTSFISDSLDAFIDQLKCPQSSSTLSPAMPSSILDAEDTCHSFAFSKLSSSKDYLNRGRSAFSELSSQDVASRPFNWPKYEVYAQDGVDGSNAVQEPKTDPLPYSAGVHNNENSLGLSTIRWNDSLGPFDIPFSSRQIVKDDSIGISGFVR